MFVLVEINLNHRTSKALYLFIFQNSGNKEKTIDKRCKKIENIKEKKFNIYLCLYFIKRIQKW